MSFIRRMLGDVARKGPPPEAAERLREIYASIGQFIVGWATVESLFISVFEVLLGTSNENASVVFYSIQSNRQKGRLLTALAFDNMSEAERRALATLLRRFKPITKLRNELAHSSYNQDVKTGLLNFMTTANMDSYSGGRPTQRIPIDRAWQNRISHMSKLLHELNLDLWDYITALKGLRLIDREETREALESKT
ncbi:MAG: hypothetical protein Q8R44_07405 [Novosphingobium sp.]|nr:hypothetical protein [Novosphingobium sp.]